MGARGSSPVDVIEAAYAVDQPCAAWMKGIVDASAPLLDEGCGLLAMLYDASGKRMQAHALYTTDAALAEDVASIVGGLDEEYVARSYRSLTCALATETLGIEGTDFRRLEARGVVDLLGINGFDPSGSGFFLGALRRTRRKVTAAQRTLWSRVAAHLASAYRVQRRLASATERPADAILTPAGRVEHAETAATAVEARKALREGVLRMERARGKLRGAPDEAVAEWSGLVDARWTLVDRIDVGGRRYVLARRNDPPVPRHEVLSKRERQVVAFAALGHHDKLIAYELGIAHSTVRVLIARAARKLGATTREELVAKASPGGRAR